MNGFLVFGLIGYAYEYIEKGGVFGQAKATALETGKPLLNAGCGWGQYWPAIEGSDVNLDVVYRNVPRFVLASVEDMPYPDKHFGAVFCSHILEHVEDLDRAVAELDRVADYQFVIVPKPIWPSNWLNLGHKRYFVGSKIYERTSYGWRTR